MSTPPEWCRRDEVLALLDHYIGEFPADAQVLGFVRDAVTIGLEQHTRKEGTPHAGSRS